MSCQTRFTFQDNMAAVSKLDYLKKYVSKEEDQGHKKVRRKKKNVKKSRNIMIIDNDVKFSDNTNRQGSDYDDEFELEDEKPQVFVDGHTLLSEHNERMGKYEENRWAPISSGGLGAKDNSAEDSSGGKSLDDHVKRYDSLNAETDRTGRPNHRASRLRHDSDDLSPKMISKDSPDLSPRRIKREHSDSDLEAHGTGENESSGPRRGNQRHDSPDLSPQRSRRRKSSSSDLSPKRLEKRESAKKGKLQHSPDLSPRRRHDSSPDLSPERIRKNQDVSGHEKVRRTRERGSPDLSPTRPEKRNKLEVKAESKRRHEASPELVTSGLTELFIQ